MRDRTFRTRLFLCFLVVILAGMALPFLYARETVRQDLLSEAMRTTRSEARMVRLFLLNTPGLSPAGVPEILELIGRDLQCRITYVDDEGRVLAEADPLSLPGESLNNHADRLEIRLAREKGEGASVRYSETMETEMVYAAVTFPGAADLPPGVIRVAAPYAGVLDRAGMAAKEWFTILCSATLLALVLAYAFSARLERSLSDMIRVVQAISTEARTRRRLHIVPGREFRTLARAVNEMADRIESNIRTIDQQKAQLETILEFMDEGVLVLGKQGRIQLVNKSLVRLFPQLEGAEGRYPVEAIPVPELQQALDRLIAAPGPEAIVTALQIEPHPGFVLSVHLARPPEALHDVLAVAVFHDVSELVRLMRVRRDFVANVSHELRTPLTAIQGYAETLLELPAGDGENRARFLETIRRHAGNMSRMVEDLLSLARIESGSIPMHPEPVDPLSSLLEAEAACRSLLESRHLNVKASFEEGLAVLADSHFLEQVFRNLLENACRYAPEGSEISVSCRIMEREAVFSVCDKGPGIPSEDLDRIFERFYRVEKHRGERSVTGPGTGLGLAICKHIVERLRGRIWAENAPGACLRFTLPLVGRATRDGDSLSDSCSGREPGTGGPRAD